MLKQINYLCFGLVLQLVMVNIAWALEKDTIAPNFKLSQIGSDKIIELNHYRGKVVYIDFWASWCAPCRVSFPLLNQLYLDKKDHGFEIIAINLDEDDNDLQRFLKLYSPDFILVRDKQSRLPESYQVQAMPSSFLVDKNGKIRYSHKGFKKNDMQVIAAKVDQLIGE